MLLLLLFGLLLFRFAHRRLLSLLFQEPPRSTHLRFCSLPFPGPRLTAPTSEIQFQTFPTGSQTVLAVHAGARRGGITASQSTSDTRPRVVPCRA